MSKNIGVAAVGDVLDINTWSNIPYFFYKAGAASQLFNQPWRLDLNRFDNSRKLWNLKQLVTAQGKGGYQYSEAFLDKAETQITRQYFSSQVISFNQLFPRAASVRKEGGRMYYYIDATLTDLFNEPSYSIRIPDRMMVKAIQQEKENFEQAEKVVSMGHWVHESLRSAYKLPDDKILQILPGANMALPADFIPQAFRPQSGIDRDLVLGFIGKDWQRKGLLFLLDVRDELEKLGLRCTVKAIGNFPEELRKRSGFLPTGFLNKHTDNERFVRSVATCDFGCLFSETEALGISTLEFLYAGVPVIGWNHQGLRDTLLPGASLSFEKGLSAHEVASRLADTVRDDNKMSQLKNTATQRRVDVSWENTINQWKKVLL